MSGVEIDLLGRFAVRCEGRVLADAEFGGRRVRELLRILAIERGRVLSRDALIEALWGEQPPADPATNLNVVVNRARRALRQPGVLETVSGGYLLCRDADIVVDVELFERAVAAARAAHTAGDLPAAVALGVDALQLWAEPLPDDAYAEWAGPHRYRLQRVHQEALELVADAALGTGQTRIAVEHASRAVELQPLREAARLLLVRGLAASGDRAAAIAAYLDLRRVLADELGVDPSAEAAVLYDDLLHGRERSPTQAPATPARPFVGRDLELTALRSLDRDQRIAAVAGRSGSGKSRLLDALIANSDRPVLFARALLPERDEPWSVVRSLAEAAPGDAVTRLNPAARAALFPEANGSSGAIDGQSSRALARQGLVRLVESTAPSLVIVDDLQWADSSSLDVLSVLIGRGADVVLVLAYRPEEVAPDTPVAEFLTLAREAHGIEVVLGPLPAHALQALVPSPEVAAALAEQTDGTPFAVLQVVRALEREGSLRRSPAGTWDFTAEPPVDRVRDLARAGKRDAVWRQFQRQPSAARDILASLALLGRPVPARVLAAASGDQGDVLALLRDLSHNHLVRHDQHGFRTEHDVISETIRDRLDPVERARLHHRLALALETEGGAEEELAHHLAGAGDTTAAAEAYAVSARVRLDRYANHEACDLASAGLRLAPATAVRTALLEVRAEARARHGDLDAARDDLRTALAEVTSRPDRARLLTRLAGLTQGSDDLERAAELADLALIEAADDSGARARALYVRALIDMNLDRPESAEVGFDEALELFTANGDPTGMADIVEAKAMTSFGFSDVTAGERGFDRAAKLFADSGNLLREVFPRSTHGHALMFADRPQEGLAETTRALGLARELGYADAEAMVLWHHSELLVACGRSQEGLAAAEEGLALARRVGHRSWTTTALLAIGVARQALGDLTGATAAFEECIETSEEQLPLFRCWGHARLARVLIALGDQERAAQHIEVAYTGPELVRHEARLARCELAIARGDADAPAVLTDALASATARGHRASAVQIRQLLNSAEGTR